MKVISHGANRTEVEIQGVTIFFSYRTPVAANIAGAGFFRTEEKFSVTTTKHINQWLDGAQADVVPQSWFDSFVVRIDEPEVIR